MVTVWLSCVSHNLDVKVVNLKLFMDISILFIKTSTHGGDTSRRLHCSYKIGLVRFHQLSILTQH